MPSNDRISELQDAIRETVLQRQELRATGASRARVEWNRLVLVRLHWKLSYALIDLNVPASAQAA